MKFIDDICDKMIFPLKIRYSLNDLGSFFLNKEISILLSEKEMILMS